MQNLLCNSIKAILGLVFFFFIGCSGGTEVIEKKVSDGGTELGNPDNEIVVAGYAQKGPFQKFSTVYMYELDDNLEQTGRSFDDQTDEAGYYNIPASLASNYIKLAIIGYYFDEISYDPEDPDYLYSGDVQTSALANVSGNNEINVNILTSIAKETILALMDDGMTFDQANEQACVYVLNAFGITDLTSTLFEDMAVLEDPASDPEEGNKILLAVSAIMMQMAHDADDVTGDSVPASLNEIRNIIIADIADNYVLDNTDIQAAIEAARLSLDHVSVRSHMEENFPDYRIPRFEDYIIGDLDIRWNGFDCAANSISSIEVEIFDTETGLINAGPWSCSPLQGMVGGLNAGTYDTIRLIFKNDLDEVIYTAQKENVTVLAGQTVIVNFETADFTTGSISVEWDIVDFLHKNIATIEAVVYNDLNTIIKTGGPWDVNDNIRSIGAIEPLTNGRVELIFRDIYENILFQSDITGVDVVNGYITFIGPFVIVQPKITAPLNHSTFREGDSITFSGTGFDYNGISLSGSSLVWSSDIDGLIGTGSTFSKSDLSNGSHCITLTALDDIWGGINVSITLNIRIVNNTIYVGPLETYTTIQAAVDAADPGDIIIVRDGIYNEHVTVPKEVAIRSENGYASTTVSGPGIGPDTFHVFDILHDYVEIDGFTILTPNAIFVYASINLNNRSYCTLENNKCGSADTNTEGFRLYNSSYNHVINNIFENCSNAGVMLYNNSDRNIISGNLCANSEADGMVISSSNYNIISGNECSFNEDADGIRMVNSNNNTVSDNTFYSNYTAGIYMYRSNNNSILNNFCYSNAAGIWFQYASGNNVSGNSFEDNGTGIRVRLSSNSNSFYLNNLDGNTTNVRSTENCINTWHTPYDVSYIYNETYRGTGTLGNYFSDHDHTDDDGNGVTNTPYDLSGTEPDDVYALAMTIDNYYLGGDNDIDVDLLPNNLEDSTCTDSNNHDTDGDGLFDGLEDANQNGVVDTGAGGESIETDPCQYDTDGDGLSDGVEDANQNGVVDTGAWGEGGETDPRRESTDSDSLPDGWEVLFGLDPLSGVGDNGDSGDPDGDGYTNLEEFIAGTDPKSRIRWEFYVNNIISSTPAIAADGTIVLCTCNGIYGLSPDKTVEWTIPGDDIGLMMSSPAIGHNGTAYFGTGFIWNAGDGFYAVDPENGNIKWKYPVVQVFSSPAIGYDGTIYFGAIDGNLYALTPEGDLKWDTSSSGINLGLIVSSPTISCDGTLYIGSENEGTVYAFDTETGEKLWEYDTEDKIYSSPTIGSDGTIYIGSNDGYLYAFDPDGSLQWSYEPEPGAYVAISPLIDADGYIYIGTYKEPETEGEPPTGTLHKLDATDPNNIQLIWKYQSIGTGATPVIGDNNRIYASISGTLIAIDMSSGLAEWTCHFSESYESGITSPLLGADGTIYVGSSDGVFYAIEGDGATVADTQWPTVRHNQSHTGNELNILPVPSAEYPTIQSAVDVATGCDVVMIDDGTYTENVNVDNPVIITSRNGNLNTFVAAADSEDHVFDISADNVTINGLTIYGATGNDKSGIYGQYASGLTIENNRCGDVGYINFTGVQLREGGISEITNNICNYNTNAGIIIYDDGGTTIVDSNTCSSNDYFGMQIYNSNNNIISNNAFSDNPLGIQVNSANNNTFINNTCISNDQGLRFYSSSGNTFYLNNFINNPIQIETEAGLINTWQSTSEIIYTYTSTEYTGHLGNYYSDHDLADADGDGVTDNPYDLPENEPDDLYPLADISDNYN